MYGVRRVLSQRNIFGPNNAAIGSFYRKNDTVKHTFSIFNGARSYTDKYTCNNRNSDINLKLKGVHNFISHRKLWTSSSKNSSTNDLQQLIKEYGSIGVGVHIVISLTSLASLIFLVRTGIDVPSLIERVGINIPILSPDSLPSVLKEFPNVITGWLIYKAIFPIRAPLTIIAVPIVSKVLKKFKPKK